MTKEEIIEIRKSLRLTQQAFAALLGTTVVSVSRWENGRTTPSRLYIREIRNLKAKYGN